MNHEPRAMNLTWIEVGIVVDIPFVVVAHQTPGKVHRLSVNREASFALTHDITLDSK